MSKSYNIISMAGAVLLLAGAVLQITRWELAPYLYTLGAVMFGYVQVMGNRYDGRNFIIKRLRRQQIFGAVALVFTGVLMFTMKRNEWIVSFHCRCPGTLYGFPYSAGVGEGETLRNLCHFFVRVYQRLIL